MGLFDKAKKAMQPEPASTQEPGIENSTEEDVVWINLTENMTRVELDGDKAYVDYAEIKENGDKIRIASRGIVIAEIGKRGKAYKEIEPYVGRTAEAMSMTLKTGDYGDYYRARLKFVTNVAKITF